MTLELSDEMPQRLAALEGLVQRSGEVLEAATTKARDMLSSGEEFGWDFVKLDPLPEGIASAGLFVLPAGSTPTPHRHPNSIQHMRHLAGEAVVRISLRDETLKRLVTEENPWTVIQDNATHGFEVGGDDLVVISFHTVPQEELLEVTETGERHY